MGLHGLVGHGRVGNGSCPLIKFGLRTTGLLESWVLSRSHMLAYQASSWKGQGMYILERRGYEQAKPTSRRGGSRKRQNLLRRSSLPTQIRYRVCRKSNFPSASLGLPRHEPLARVTSKLANEALSMCVASA